MKEVHNSEDGKPPILGSWKNMYWTVLVIYVFMIVSLYFFTQAFS